LLLAAPFLVAALVSPAQSDTKITDWAEYRFVAKDPKHKCIRLDDALYCPRKGVPVSVVAKKVKDAKFISKLQEINRQVDIVIGSTD